MEWDATEESGSWEKVEEGVPEVPEARVGKMPLQVETQIQTLEVPPPESFSFYPPHPECT